MIRLSYTQYNKFFTCRIDNITELKIDQLKKLENFASKRSGKLDYEKESLTIPKKIDIQYLTELFNLSEIEVFITEKEPQVNYKLNKMTINFGKFKGTKWSDLEDDYLRWLSQNINGEDKQTALLEIAHRVKSTSKKEPKELKYKIGFGKHRGQEWGELPKDYLLWVASNIQGEASKYAQTILNWKS